MTELVSVTVRDEILHLVLDAPRRRNALSIALLHRLSDLLAAIDRAETRAVVLSGNGMFSAGADFADLTGTSGDLGYDDVVAATTQALRAVPVPVIVAIEGACIGAAVDLALAADLRVAAMSAWLRVPAVELGLLYNPAAIGRLHANLPRQTVTRLLVLAERFTAEDAHAAGLVSHVVADGAAVEFGHTLALAVPDGEAVIETKRLLAALDQGTVDAAHWDEVRHRLLASPQRRGAVTSAQDRLNVKDRR